MKKKVSITLSAEVLAKVDLLAGSKHSRSAIIELVLQNYLRQRERADSDAQDLERINAAADRLNQEAEAVLDYQVIF
ncbi:MAG TPA: ribbon-helix-helix protein, CopG family [Candidatus Angelobacter sp.]|jgi:metal-responsive CopG/Arc/MetJ family transcriptional regulator